jgi:arylsulfatase A-like enzyme
MDWTATILSLGGIVPNREISLDGIDLMPVLTNPEKVVERTLYWRTFQRQKQKAIRNEDWKYLQDEQGEYLFNLVADPSEKTDLKFQKKRIFNQLKRKFRHWEESVLEPIPL